MYQQITQDFLKDSCDNWNQFKSSEVRSRYDCYGTSIVYYGLDHVPEFKSQHLRKFFTIQPARVYFTEVTGPGLLYPHKDHNTTVVLNYYISSANCKTIFYDIKDETIKPFTYKDKETSNIFKPEDLVEIDSFIAKDGEAYLLDVTKIHAVQKTSDVTRQFISYQWNSHTFAEILSDLNFLKK